MWSLSVPDTSLRKVRPSGEIEGKESRMSKKPQKILVNGYGWTGSTAMVQMLSEYCSIGVVPNEFDDFRVPGGIGDAIRQKNSGEGVQSGTSVRFQNMKRYLLPFLVRGLVPDFFWPVSARGGSFNRRDAYATVLNYIREYFFYEECKKQISRAADEDEVFRAASEWIESIVALYGRESDFIVFDQPVIFDCFTEYWSDVFSGFKMILVARNPLDQMGTILRDGLHLIEAPNWSVRFVYGRDRYVNRPLEFFMETTMQRYQYIVSAYENLGSSNMLVVRFESLVNSYHETKEIIEDFLDINPTTHATPQTQFRPIDSRARITARDMLCERSLAKARGMQDRYDEMLQLTNAI